MTRLAPNIILDMKYSGMVPNAASHCGVTVEGLVNLVEGSGLWLLETQKAASLFFYNTRETIYGECNIAVAIGTEVLEPTNFTELGV